MRSGAQWVQYEWTQPVSTGEISVFWWNFENSLRLTSAYRLKYWTGSEFLPVINPVGLGLVNNQFNKTTFKEVQTTRLRLEVDSADRFIATLLEWIVIKTPDSPDIPPIVNAGADRSVMLGGKTYLSGKVRSVSPVSRTEWSKTSGPGDVTFRDHGALETSAIFSKTGDYILTLTATEGNLSSSSPLTVKVTQPPQTERLDVVYTKRYSIDNPLWNSRAKVMIVNWIPWCIDQINRTDLTLGPGDWIILLKQGKH